MADIGIHIDASGIPYASKPAETSNCPLLPSPPPKLCAAICRMFRQRRYDALLAISNPLEQARLRSAAGNGAGSWLTVNPEGSAVSLSDEQFVKAFWLRIGAPQHLRGALCQLRTIKDQEPCLQPLDASGAHALSCRCGHGDVLAFRTNNTSEIVILIRPQLKS